MKIKPVGIENVSLLVKYRMAYLAELQGYQTNAQETDTNAQERETTEEYLKKEKTEQELYLYFKEAMEQERLFAFMAVLEAKEAIEAEVVSFGAMVVKKIPGDFDQSVYLEGDILNMYTVPNHRKKGISALILKRLIDEAKKRGISKIALHTTKAGEKLYRKEGFQEPIYPVLELPL